MTKGLVGMAVARWLVGSHADYLGPTIRTLTAGVTAVVVLGVALWCLFAGKTTPTVVSSLVAIAMAAYTIYGLEQIL